MQTKPKVSNKQFDEAFDNLAAFLFEEYRKRKEVIAIREVKMVSTKLIKT